MTPLTVPGSATRRRGANLENALLDATWTVLGQLGYARMTFEAVAQQAATSKSVIYRRWPTLPRLVLAAVQHRASPQSSAPDTGTLRGDLYALLSEMGERLGDADLAAPGLLADFRDDPSTLGEVREAVFGAWTGAMTALVARAAARGEIPTADLNERRLTAPLDLARFELLTTARKLSPAALSTLVDHVALPLLDAVPTTTTA